MNRLTRTLVTIFMCSVMAGSVTGCSNPFVAGLRKLFVRRPAATTTMTNAEVEQAYRQVKPVVTIDDSLGHRREDEARGREEAQARDEVVRGDEAAAQDGVATPTSMARCRELAVTKPYDPIVRYQMGRLYLQQGLLKEATYEFDMATSLDPQFTDAFILLGRTLRQRGLYDLAVAKLNVAIRLHPELPTGHIEAGICWDQRGYHDKARAAYRKALALAPGDSRIYNNLGYSYFLEGDSKRAIKYYKKALQLDSDNAQIHNNLALAYGMRRKWSKALHHFTQALGEAAAQNNIGHLLLRAGRIDEAVAHLELAVRLEPNSVRALGNLESALRLKGRIDDAQKIHARLVEVEGTHTQPRLATNRRGPAALVDDAVQK